MTGNICQQYLNVDLLLGSNDQENAVQDDGLQILDSSSNFEEDDIKTVCKSVRKLGGTIVNHQYTLYEAQFFTATDASARNIIRRNHGSPRIPNLGMKILTNCEQQIISAACAIKQYDMVHQTITHDSLNLDRLKAYNKHQYVLKNH